MLGARATPVRERILTTARTLFYSRGINATGIDLIIEHARIAKASLYHHFPSKEQLVTEYLADLRRQFESALDRAVSERGHDLVIPFDLLTHTLANGEFFGCPFINALTEMPTSRPVIEEVRLYRSRVLDHFTQAVSGDSLLAQDLMLVYDGVFTGCKIDPDLRVVRRARELAQRIAGQFTNQEGQP